MDAVYVAVLFGLIGLVLWAARRETEIFRISIAHGKAKVERGRVPPSFLGDLRDVVGHVVAGSVRAVKEGGEGRLVLSPSIDERTAQRLRNAYALDSRKRL